MPSAPNFQGPNGDCVLATTLFYSLITTRRYINLRLLRSYQTHH